MLGMFVRANDNFSRPFVFTSDVAGPIRLLTIRTASSSRQSGLERPVSGAVSIRSLHTKRLLAPLSAIVERDDGGYIAQTIDLPLYGAGATPVEAVDALRWEIESLYEDLMEDNQFSDDWLKRKKLLSAIIRPHEEQRVQYGAYQAYM